MRHALPARGFSLVGSLPLVTTSGGVCFHHSHFTTELTEAQRNCHVLKVTPQLGEELGLLLQSSCSFLRFKLLTSCRVERGWEGKREGGGHRGREKKNYRE